MNSKKRSINTLLTIFLLNVVGGLGQKFHEFAFTQCDCQSGQVLGEGDVLETFSSAPDLSFDCGEVASNGFPREQGIKFFDLTLGRLPLDNLDEGFLFIMRVRHDDSSREGVFFSLDNSEVIMRINGGSISVVQQSGATLNLPMLFGVDVTIAYGFFVDEFGTRTGFLARSSYSGLGNAFITGGRGLPASDATLVLAGINTRMLFKGFRVETGIDFSQATFITDLDEAFARFKNTPVIPPVDESSLLFFTEEDTESVVDISSAIPNSTNILFSFNTLGLPGNVTLIDTTSFSYLPLPNFAGDRSFTLEYGVNGSECTNTVPLTLRVNNTNDVPLINNSIELDVFVGVQFKYTLENIATVVDFFQNGDTIPSTLFQVDSAPSGMVFTNVGADGNCESVGLFNFELSNSSVTFCILSPPSLLLNRDSVQFTIKTGEDTGTGKFTVHGIAPVETLNGVSFATLEDKAVTIDPALLINPLIDGDVSIRITRLPDVLKELNFTLNSTVSASTRINFQPATGVFNSFRFDNALRSVGSDGVPIGICPQQQRDINGFCPITFSFVAVFGDFVSSEGIANILIEAIDNFGTSVNLVDSNTEVIDIVAQSTKREATSNIPALRITSDNGESVFPVALQITATGAASFQFPSNIQGVEIVDTNFKGFPALTCTFNSCTGASLHATPNKLQTFLSETVISVNLDEQVVFPGLQIKTNDTELLILYDVEIRDSTENENIANFFQDEANIIFISIFVLLLAVLITIIFVFFQKIGGIQRTVNEFQQREVENEEANKEV